MCKEKFQSNEAAIKHYKQQHLYFSYICDKCEQYFQRKCAFDDHHATLHGRSIDTAVATISRNGEPNNIRSASIASDRNSNKFVAAPAAKKRIIISENATHGDKLRFMKCFNRKHCVECGIDFRSTNEIAQHFDNEHQMEVYMCSLCSRGYLHESSMQQHRRECAKEDAEDAQNTPASEKNFRVKVDASAGQKRVFMKFFNRRRCVECKEDFGSMEEINEHFKVMHHIDVLLCDVCMKKGYLTIGALVQHKNTEHKTTQVSLF